MITILKKLSVCFALSFGIICLTGFSSTIADELSINELTDKFGQEKYSEVFAPLNHLADSGDDHAQYLLGLMYHFGLGVSEDQDKAFILFEKSAFNRSSGGHNGAGEMLARSFLMNEKSRHYDPEFGLRILAALSDLGTLGAQLYLGGYLVAKDSEEVGETSALVEAEMHFQRAATQHNDPGAHLMLYMFKKEKFENEPHLIDEAEKSLIIAANNPHQHQANASLELAFFYKGQAGDGWQKKYFQYIEQSSDLDNVTAMFLLGKAKMLGIDEEPNYPLARSLLEKASQRGHKRAGILLRDLKKKMIAEAKLDSYEAPTNWINSFLAIQSYSAASGSSAQTEQVFKEAGDELFSSGGTSYRRSGRMITGSDGSAYAVKGKTIQNLNTGTTFRYSSGSNSLMGTNGVKYNFRGNQIYGTDGSMCSSVGKSVFCY